MFYINRLFKCFYSVRDKGSVKRKCKNARKYCISLFFISLCTVLHGQDFQDSTQIDSARYAMDTEEGINYTPTYYYYIHSLLPTTPKRMFADTSIFNLYNQDVSLHSRNLYANLGMFGHAHFPMNFTFERLHGFTYKTLPFLSYLRTIENWKMYHPDKIYTHLEWNFISGGEHHFSAAHAQKITDDLNFGLSLETVFAQGRYVQQKVRDVNVGVTFDYLMPSHRYGFNAYYICNYLNLNENGGILHDSLFENGNTSLSLINVRFNDANNTIFQNTFFFRHFLALSGKDTMGMAKKGIGFLVHDIQFNASKNRFTDHQRNSDFYDVFYFHQDSTSDSIKNYLLRNSFMWTNYLPNDTLPNKANYLHIAAGILYDFIQVNGLQDFISVNGGTSVVIRSLKPFINNQLTPFGRVHTQLFSRLDIEASAFFTLNGYNAGDLTLNGKMGLDIAKKENSKHEIAFKLGFYNYSPDYFFSHAMTNNYFWDNELKKQQTLFLGAEWNRKEYSLGLNYYSLHNYTLLDINSLPMQLSDFANVYQFSAYIPFHYKGFGFNTNIYAQYTDNEVVRIPNFAGRQSVYYGFYLFKKALYLQSGFDFMYNTAYYANAYNPALQQFQLQNTREIGNYGYLDFYLRAKINRFVVSAKVTHFWAGLFGKNYYLVPHYPARDFGFAAGVWWRFYD